METINLQFATKPWKTGMLLIVWMLFGFLQPLLLPASVQAEEKVWIGETGRWDEAGNWDSLGQPQDGDDVFLTQTDAIDRDVYYGNTSYPDATLESLNISATGTGNMTLNLGQDSLKVHNELVGYGTWETGSPAHGTGAITQTGGEHFVNGNLQLGSAFGTGTYNMIEGNLSAENISVGYEIDSLGTINQSGGTVTAQSLDFAPIYGSVGTYNLSGGSLTTHSTSATMYGDAYFNQSGGTHVTETLNIGYDGDIYYNLSGGTLEADSVIFGRDAGSHVFNQTGGTFNVNDALYLGNTADFNLIDGTLTARSLINNSYFREFNYTGGDLNADITNFGTATLSGDGTRIVNGDIINNGVWESTNTTVSYKGSFANSSTFNSDNSIQYFEELTLTDSGSMTGSGEAPWFVKEQLLGISTLDGTGSNIFGEDGFNVYYNPWATGNEYLGGLDYDLTDGGMLTALDGIVDTDQCFTTDYLTLGDTFTFDYWWEMGMEPTESNFDVLFFNGTEWETFGWELNFGGSSDQWNTASFWVPSWLRGDDVQIMFSLLDWGQVTDPTVYLNNISSTPVPEPATIILLGTGLLGLAGALRKNS